MNLHHIKLKIFYEIKSTRRNIIFNILVFFALLATIILPFVFFPYGTRFNFGQLDLPWYAQALSSSIPFMTAYYYNYVQLIFVIFMASNDLRCLKLTAMTALEVHTQSNIDVVVGRFIGRVVIFGFMNVLIFLMAICCNVIYFPRVFDIWLYLFYGLTLTFPALIFFLGFSALVTRFINNQGISALVLLLFLGGATCYGAGRLYHIFDPLARYIPNLFSDFTGHVFLYPYMLHRFMYLFAGLFFLIISTLGCKRISNSIHPVRTIFSIACMPLLVFMVFLFMYCSYFNEIKQDENRYRQLYIKYDKVSKQRVLVHDIVLEESENGGFSAESKMIIMNPGVETASVILYLNPGLQVDRLHCNNKQLSFERDGQMIIVDKLLKSGDSCELTVNYKGIIDNSVCYLDVPLTERNSPEVNSRGIFHFGNQYAFCTENYKLMTPESLWYPVCEAPVCFSVTRKVNFTRYTLKVFHNEQRMAVSQGDAHLKPGESVFLPECNLQGISLSIGKYQRKSIQVDSICIDLYYLMEHNYLLPSFEIDTTELKKTISDIKWQIEERKEISGIDPATGKSVSREINKQALIGEPNLRYPFNWLKLIETPAGFNVHLKNDEIDGERVQAGLVFLSEKLCTQYFEPCDGLWRAPRDIVQPDFHESFNAPFSRFADSNLRQGKCNLKPTLRKSYNHLSSVRFPMIDEIFSVLMDQDIVDPLKEYDVIEYMSEHSLMDALNDSCLRPDELNGILKRKSQELLALICACVPREDFQNLYFRFFSSFRFTDVDFQVFADEFNQRFDMDLNEILEKWYSRRNLPVFKTTSKCYIETSSLEGAVNNEYANLYFVHKVFNTSEEDGVIKLNPGGYWLIPRRTCKNIIVMYNTSTFISFGLEMPMSQNLPSTKRYKDKIQIASIADLQTGISDSDTLCFREDSFDIIVDNMNPGCKVMESKFWLRLWLDKYKINMPIFEKIWNEGKKDNKWFMDIDQNYYGFPVQSALCKRNKGQNIPVEWTIEITENGKYELFAHCVRSSRQASREWENTRYFSIQVGEDEHQVEINVNETNEGWISLGKYEVENQQIKVVQYGKEDFKEDDIFNLNDFLIADAIKIRRTY